MLKKFPTWLLVVVLIVVALYVFPGVRAKVRSVLPIPVPGL